MARTGRPKSKEVKIHTSYRLRKKCLEILQKLADSEKLSKSEFIELAIYNCLIHKVRR